MTKSKLGKKGSSQSVIQGSQDRNLEAGANLEAWRELLTGLLFMTQDHKPTDDTTRLNTEILELTDIISQMDLTGIYRTFYPNTKEYTFSASHGTFSKIGHILRYKTILNRYKKTEITSCILTKPYKLKLDTNSWNIRRLINSRRLNNSLLNENDYRTSPNLSDSMKVDLIGKFIGLSAYIKESNQRDLT